MKVAICYPSYGATVSRVFCNSLADMVRVIGENPRHGEEPITITLFNAEGLLPKTRNTLVKAAREWGADWILWLDTDHGFPPETLHRLLLVGQPIVGANYLRRAGPGWSAWHRVNGEMRQIETTREKADGHIMERVDLMGMGVLLTSAEVFTKLRANPFRFESNEDGDVAEDGTFIRDAIEAGYAPYVDHHLSWHVVHVASVGKSPQAIQA